jgi:hypothetical protein
MNRKETTTDRAERQEVSHGLTGFGFRSLIDEQIGSG